MHGPSYQQKIAFINERDRQARLADEDGGAAGGFTGIIVLIEFFLAFVVGMTALDNLGSESLRAVKYAPLWAGVAGITLYIILHKIPVIRWLMILAMITLWTVFAYTTGLMVIGQDHEGFHLATHKGPYIAAGIAGLVRAFMYR